MVGKQSTNYLHLSSILPFSEAKTISYKKVSEFCFSVKKILRNSAMQQTFILA